MAREHQKDVAIDNSLAYCYSKLNKLTDLEELLGNSNSVDVLRVGDRCFECELYEASKILY